MLIFEHPKYIKTKKLKISREICLHGFEMQVFLSTVCLIMWWAILIHLVVLLAFNAPWQILTLPANTTIWSRRWNRIATVNTTTLGPRDEPVLQLSCGNLDAFHVVTQLCLKNVKILAKNVQLYCNWTQQQLVRDTVVGHEPHHIYLAVTLLSERWCGREEKILDPFHVVTQFCGNSCQKCANYFCRGGVNFIKCQNMCIVLNSNFNLNYFTFHLQISK